jgi:hypothetical protein
MRAFYKAEDFLDEAAHSVAKPTLRRMLVRLGRLAGAIGDLTRTWVR